MYLSLAHWVYGRHIVIINNQVHDCKERAEGSSGLYSRRTKSECQVTGGDVVTWWCGCVILKKLGESLMSILRYYPFYFPSLVPGQILAAQPRPTHLSVAKAAKAGLQV